MRILIISCFFPPQNVIASQRPYSWAKHWSRLGHEVTVLTPTKDLSKSDLTPMSFDGFRVIEAPPGPLFHFMRNRLRGERAKVADSGRPPGPASPGKEAMGWKHRLWMGLKERGLLSSARMPDPFDLWLFAALRAMPHGEFDLIVSTFGPYVSHLLGWRAKRRSPRAVWICDFRDLWTRNHVYPGIWPFTLFERRLETLLLRRCDFATTVSEPLAEILRKDHPGLRVETIPNGVDVEDLAKLSPENCFADDGRRRIVYTGSLHPVHRNPLPLLEALASLSSEERARIEIVFVGPHLAQLREVAARLGIADSVRVGDSVGREVALRMQRDADVLLFLEHSHDSTRDGVLTGKIFEYLASGRPVWAIGVTASSTIGRMLTDLRAGRAFGTDREEIAKVLRELCRARPESVATTAGMGSFDRGNLARRLLSLAGETSSMKNQQ